MAAETLRSSSASTPVSRTTLHPAARVKQGRTTRPCAGLAGLSHERRLSLSRRRQRRGLRVADHGPIDDIGEAPGVVDAASAPEGSGCRLMAGEPPVVRRATPETGPNGLRRSTGAGAPLVAAPLVTGASRVVGIVGEPAREPGSSAAGTRAGGRRAGRNAGSRWTRAAMSSARRSSVEGTSSKKRGVADGWATWVSSWASNARSTRASGVRWRWITEPVVAARLPAAVSARLAT